MEISALFRIEISTRNLNTTFRQISGVDILTAQNFDLITVESLTPWGRRGGGGVN